MFRKVTRQSRVFNGKDKGGRKLTVNEAHPKDDRGGRPSPLSAADPDPSSANVLPPPANPFSTVGG